MKAKITSFIMTLLTIFTIALIGIIGFLIYNEITGSSLVSEVEDFVSNITVSTGGLDERLEEPEILQIPVENEKIKSTNVEATSTTRYFYNQLDENAKIIYNALETNKENMKTGTFEINFGTKFSSVLSKTNGDQILGEYYQNAIDVFTNDNPEIFYMDFTKLYLNIETTTRGNNKTYKVMLNQGNNTNYLNSEFPSQERVKVALNEVQNVREYFIQNKKATTYENIKMVHDYLVDSIEYDETLAQENICNLYGALINKKCVCEGYAEAFKFIMDGLDIPCVIVSGQGTNSEGQTENHAWNYVQINNEWYAVDVTWDDPIIIGGGFLNKEAKYKYFLKGESDFNKTHSPSGQFTENGKIFKYPVLSQNDY